MAKALEYSCYAVRLEGVLQNFSSLTKRSYVLLNETVLKFLLGDFLTTEEQTIQ